MIRNFSISQKIKTWNTNGILSLIERRSGVEKTRNWDKQESKEEEKKSSGKLGWLESFSRECVCVCVCSISFRAQVLVFYFWRSGKFRHNRWFVSGMTSTTCLAFSITIAVKTNHVHAPFVLIWCTCFPLRFIIRLWAYMRLFMWFLPISFCSVPIAFNALCMHIIDYSHRFIFIFSSVCTFNCNWSSWRWRRRWVWWFGWNISRNWGRRRWTHLQKSKEFTIIRLSAWRRAGHFIRSKMFTKMLVAWRLQK